MMISKIQKLIGWLPKMGWMGLVALLLVGGCNKQPSENTASAPPAATTPAPPPAVPAPTQPVAQGQPSAPGEPPAGPAPGSIAPAPPPPPPVYTVPSGTHIAVTLSEAVSAKNNNVGDTFHGTLAQSIRAGGVTVLKAGTPVSGTVVAAKGQGKFKGAGDLAIQLTTVGSESVATAPYEKTLSGKGKRSTAMIGGGGGGGALIGGLAGGGKGALIGGLVGAGVGTAGAALTGNKDVAIPAESVVTFTVTSPLRIVGKAKAKGADNGLEQ